MQPQTSRRRIRHRRWALGLLLLAAAPAYAHGIEALIFFVLIYGTGFGVLGGVLNGLIRSQVVLGLLLTLLLFFLAGVGFTAFDALTGEPIPGVPPTPFLEDALFTTELQAYGILPLVLGFLCSHVVVRFVRSRVRTAKAGKP